MPFSAPLPMPTIRLIGVASPRAHGQAMISTGHGCDQGVDQLRLRAKIEPDHEGEHGQDHHDRHEVAGNRVGQACDGGLAVLGVLHHLDDLRQGSILADLGCAEFERAGLVSVAPITSSPAFLDAGRLSPVSMDSSTAELPSRITPSTGTFSPGRT